MRYKKLTKFTSHGIQYHEKLFLLGNCLICAIGKALALTTPLLASQDHVSIPMHTSSAGTSVAPSFPPLPRSPERSPTFPIGAPQPSFENAIFGIIGSEFKTREYAAVRAKLTPLFKMAKPLIMAGSQSEAFLDAYYAGITIIIAMQDYEICDGIADSFNLKFFENKNTPLEFPIPSGFYKTLKDTTMQIGNTELKKASKLVYYSLMDQGYIEKQASVNPRQEIWNLAMGDENSSFYAPAAFMMGSYFRDFKVIKRCMGCNTLKYKQAAYFWYNAAQDEIPDAKIQADLLKNEIESATMARFDALFSTATAALGIAGGAQFVAASPEYASYLAFAGIGVSTAWQISKSCGLKALDLMALFCADITPSSKLYTG